MEGFAAVDAAVGWDKLLRARGQARQIADLTEENPLVPRRNSGAVCANSRRCCLRRLTPRPGAAAHRRLRR
ncbi:transposase Tn3 family protein [Novosphingobium sp. Rr 2-17]|nr:transposase Tn3 family protein [Novosphingobium sp. Rr 2-17]